MEVSVWIIICLAIVLKIECTEIAGSQLEQKELTCVYNLVNGDQVCDCRNRNEAFVLQPIRGTVKDLIVENCRYLIVKPATFRDVSFINNIQFKSIGKLILEHHSLSFERHMPILKVNLVFDHVNIQEIAPYAMSGYINSIKFTHCRIGKLNAYSINAVNENVERILFENTEIELVESQSLKRLHIEKFMMRNTIIRSQLPSRAFSALTITDEFSISNCSFATISSDAIDLEHVNHFVFTENIVDRLDGEAFRIKVNGRILIARNNFSQISHLALSGIHVDDGVKQHQLDIQFMKNTIISTEFPIRFKVEKGFDLRIADLYFNKTINCDQTDELMHNVFLQQYGNTVYFRLAESSNNYTLLNNILLSDCQTTSYIIAIVSVIVILVLILAIVAVALFYRFWEKHKPPQRPMNMVIPDGKTYRETQIVFQIENAGLLKTNL